MVNCVLELNCKTDYLLLLAYRALMRLTYTSARNNSNITKRGESGVRSAQSRDDVSTDLRVINLNYYQLQYS
jgi:hypothetical protein